MYLTFVYEDRNRLSDMENSKSSDFPAGTHNSIYYFILIQENVVWQAFWYDKLFEIFSGFAKNP